MYSSILDHPDIAPDVQLLLTTPDNSEQIIHLIKEKAVAMIYDSEPLFNHYQNLPDSIVDSVNKELVEKMKGRITEVKDADTQTRLANLMVKVRCLEIQIELQNRKIAELTRRIEQLEKK